MNDFFSKFFGTGGTGSSLVTTGGQIGLTLVGNKTKEIQGTYAVRLAEIAQDSGSNDQQFKVELAKLNAERDEALAKEARSKQAQVLVLVGSLAVVAAVTIILVLKKRR